MGQFLRFATLIILALIGFGSGICGLYALGYGALEGMFGKGGGDSFTGVAVVLGVVGVVIATGCFFGVRALTRRLRAHAAPPQSAPPPAPPPAA